MSSRVSRLGIELNTLGRRYSSGDEDIEIVGVRLLMVRLVEGGSGEDGLGQTQRSLRTMFAISEIPATLCRTFLRFFVTSGIVSESISEYSSLRAGWRSLREILAREETVARSQYGIASFNASTRRGEAGDGSRGGIEGKSLRRVKSGSVVIVVIVADRMCV